MKYIDVTGSLFILCGTLLIVLFAGEPDLMDAIMTNLNKG